MILWVLKEQICILVSLLFKKLLLLYKATVQLFFIQVWDAVLYSFLVS